MAFISSSNTSSRKGKVPTASVLTASIKVSTASTDVAAASLSHDTVCGMKEDRFWKKTGKKITIQGSDVAGFVKSKVECFNCHKIDHFSKECRAPRSQDRGKRESYKQGPKEEEPALKALMAIDDIGWDWSYMADEEENHALVANDEVPIEFALMAKSRSSSKNEDSGCSQHMTGNLSYLSEYEPYDGGYVSFGHRGGKIIGKGIIKTGKLEFENVYFVKELEYNLFSVSQICYNKNSVLFTESECIVLGKYFKLKDDTNVLLRTPRQHNMFTWTFFLRTKDETSSILRNFITEIENLKDLKVKIIRVLVNKYQNKTPYEIFNSITPAIGILRPFGCHVMILNTLDNLGKFDAKGDEGYFVRYSQSSKAFKVFNKRTKKVKENLHADFLENKLIEKGVSPNWLFDIDTPTNLMNYVPVVVAGKSSTNTLGTKDVASQDVKKDVSSSKCFALPNWFHKAHMETRNSNAPDGCNVDDPESSGISNPTATLKVSSADQVEPTVSLTVESEIPTVAALYNVKVVFLRECLHKRLQCCILHIVLILKFDLIKGKSSTNTLGTKDVASQDVKKDVSSLKCFALPNWFEDTFEVEADLSNMETSIPVSPTLTFRIHTDHPKSQIISPVDTHVQTRHKSKKIEEQSFIAKIHQKTILELLQFCLFSCFLSREEPKKIFDALKDPSWVEAMQEELLQFKIQNVWVLVKCPKG
nr:ribonuclease H-like domain-containing protein [Tanacetum cinerariifolium]